MNVALGVSAFIKIEGLGLFVAMFAGYCLLIFGLFVVSFLLILKADTSDAGRAGSCSVCF